MKAPEAGVDPLPSAVADIIETKLWKSAGETGAWHFLSTTKAQGAEIRAHRRQGPGFGSVRVIGRTHWSTSLFPTKDGPFLLPVKASVRKREGLEDGDFVRCACSLP